MTTPIDTASVPTRPCAKMGHGDREGLWHPVLLYRAEGDQRPQEAMFGMTLCDECKATSKPADFVSDAMWKIFAHLCPAAKRELTTLAWKHVDAVASLWAKA